jgi:homoserine O-acetyltransferase
MSPDGVGQVRTERVVLFGAEDPLVLDSGATLETVEVAYETYGRLDADRANAVVVCPALTGDAHAAGHHGDPGRRGWWDSMIGPGRAIDTDRFFVVCADLLGGCRGTTGPLSRDPSTGRAYGLRFPQLTVRDLVSVHRALVQRLEIRRVHCALGGSLGGMQALQWTLDHPAELDRALMICASARLSDQNIAFSAVARSAIMRDPDFQDGDYDGTGRGPDLGLSVARMMAHITYLSEEAMRLKFGRRRADRGQAPSTMSLVPEFEVERYLQHQGATFLQRFDALSYLYLTRVMDEFDPFEDPRDIGQIGTKMRAISFDSDWRFGSEHSRFIESTLREAGIDIDHVEIRSPWGHDSFLLAAPEYQEAVADLLASRSSSSRTSSHAPPTSLRELG